MSESSTVQACREHELFDEMPKKDTPILVGLVYDLDDHELVPDTDPLPAQALRAMPQIRPWSAMSDFVVRCAQAGRGKTTEVGPKSLDALRRRKAVEYVGIGMHGGWVLTRIGWAMHDEIRRLRGLRR